MNTSHLRQSAARLARSALRIPYIWGGSSPAEGFDCSGFVIWILQTLGALQKGDWTAQHLHDLTTAAAPGLPLTPLPGSLAFYGNQRTQITHVMMLLGDGMVCGACGGDKTVNDVIRARAIGAQVRIKPLHYRSDLVAIGPVVFPDEG